MPSSRRSVWERSDGNATDSIMVRRLYLDLAGRTPRVMRLAVRGRSAQR